MKNDPSGTIIAIALVVMLYYLFFRNQLTSALKPGTPVLSSLSGSPTYGYAAGTNPVPVNFALTSATGDQFSVAPPGYAFNSTGGVSALPDPNGIGGGFAT